jgi:arsenite-transporting ATPase
VKRPHAPRYHFFGGKGGVGKTTLAAAAALSRAEQGRRCLVVSTDPAHSLGDALGCRLGRTPRRVPTLRGLLHAVELDADAALARWLGPRRGQLATIAERGTYLDRDEVERFLGLSLPGVDELVGLLELRRLGERDAYDGVVVDTAPTGHTLRLLQMPASLQRLAGLLDAMHAKHRFLASHLGGGHRADAADALIREIEGEARALAELLRDPARTGFSWVLLPERPALEESADGLAELRSAGIVVREVVVNRLTPPPLGRCELCLGRRRHEGDVLQRARRRLSGPAFVFVPALDEEPRGLAALRRVSRASLRRPPRPGPAGGRGSSPAGRGAGRAASPSPWLEALAPPGLRLLLFGGKGGVGKTTCAIAAALALARRHPERRVLLLSTDPAHSLGDVLGQALGDDVRAVSRGARGLRARELDAGQALVRVRARYAAAVDRLFAPLRNGAVDASFDHAVLRELLDLAPPGIDELFSMLAVIEALVAPEGGRPAQDLVVLDTAPTGHTLRLLALPATALEWVRALLEVLLKYREATGLGDLAQEVVGLSRRLRALERLLHDPAATRFVAVTRPARLPRLETERLLRRLARLRLPVSAVLVNALTPPGCARCRRTAAAERRELASLARGRTLPARGCTMVVAPLVAPPPQGVRAIEAWSSAWQVDA